ncbi:MAG TPA: RNA polymerase sigma factor [Polyangiaceae bacterium]|nr:RNA polymerase sigma factor [Polyangiaceae bacterium]
MSNDLPPLHHHVQRPWRRFLEEYEPLRGDLFRYCRFLTKSAWDAEDLVQDVLARAFVSLGGATETPANPRAWLFRVASNHWLNHVKRARFAAELAPEPSHEPDPRGPREAAGSLVARLAPQERAALVLKEAFDFSLEEISAMLSTSVGGVKSALHRGRGKLEALESEQVGSAPPPVLDAFCAAFNARDIDGLTALLLDDVTLDFPGLHTDYGAAAARRALGTTMAHASYFTAPEWRAGMLEASARFEARSHRGEALVLAWWQHESGEAVRGFSRVELDGDRIASIRTYYHAPEAIAELCRELGLPCRTSGHRFW